jgi:ligand-binding SRPBCC domain-containing protein
MPKVYNFSRKQIIKTDLSTAWDFISSPANLNKITPPDMTFNILSEVPDVMHEGLLIQYKIGIPLIGEQNWVSEIKHIKEKHSFVDDQRVGPYSIWYHYHEITEHAEGIQFFDNITYSIPYGIFGEIAHGIYVKRQLKKIFDFRAKTTPGIFK